MEDYDLHNLNSATFLRRLMAGLYDWLLVLGLMMVLSVPLVALLDDAVAPGNDFYRGALLFIAAGFFIGFWFFGGQTLGMKAWRLKLLRQDGTPADLQDAIIRFAAAIVAALPAGLGFVWQVWDKDNLSWHDRWSGTRLVLLPKQTKKDL
jgi:uncharacterized RDD family membrane protein YckC